MQVSMNTFNVNNRYNNNLKSNHQQSFTGIARLAQEAGEQTVKSKLFNPIAKRYDKMTDWIADNYYGRFYQSNFAKKFIEKTSNVKNMTTHMSALGATLISGMYTVRTLQNDKLDSEKRKTLAINDVLTWGLSTAGSYLIDAKLANWWEGVTTRFVANYVDSKPEAKNIELLGDWDPKNIYKMMDEAPKIANDKINEMKAKLSPEQFEDWLINKARMTKDDLVDIPEQLTAKAYMAAKKTFKDAPEKLNEWIANSGHTKEGLEKITKTVTKGVRDLNLDFLRDRRLTTLIDGMGVLKSLFVFGMVYRYLVPVLVMKPANKIGAYMHKKNAEKAAEQNQDTKKS
ncbi:MAG: hypothetical protein E7Z93_02370 [Cyanobacteria bacterium SIG32]|nr:hypothetical protein [Cyanobacteria bacterium SIG32]